MKGVVAKLVHLQDPTTTTALEVAAGGKLYQVTNPLYCLADFCVAVASSVAGLSEVEIKLNQQVYHFRRGFTTPWPLPYFQLYCPHNCNTTCQGCRGTIMVLSCSACKLQRSHVFRVSCPRDGSHGELTHPVAVFEAWLRQKRNPKA